MKHIIVVSIDAMVFEDLEYARALPAFAKILESASQIERVKTIYPSLTHPAHATIMTGCSPMKTGITSNMIFDPENPDRTNAPWYNSISELKCDDILSAAHRRGLVTACACWPMTAYASEVVDYLVPGALKTDFEKSDDPIEVYRTLGMTECLADVVKEAIDIYGAGDVHPAVDALQAYVSAEIIRRYKPNLLLTHPSYVDNRRHATGVFSDEVKLAIRETDRWLGMLIDAVRDAGIEDETDFVLLSDHGQINITRVISPNVFLADRGYIKVDENGCVSSYDAFIKGVGASAQVYLSRPDDKKLYSEIYELLTDMASEGIYGFEKVYTEAELLELGLRGAFSFVLEGDGYTSFSDSAIRPIVKSFDAGDYRFGRGTHGHLPTKGPQPTFIASGPSFRKDVIIPEGSILNHAPTIAAALGIELPEAEGSAVYDILA